MTAQRRLAAPPGAHERACAVCAEPGERFAVSGCDPRSLQAKTVGIVAQPKGPVGSSYCQITFSTGRASGATYQWGVAWFPRAPTERHTDVVK